MIKFLPLLLLLAGCSEPAVGITLSDNPNFKVERAFTADGCTIYRFADAGAVRYFAKCDPCVPTRVEYDVSSGKSRRPESTSTGCTCQEKK